MCIRDRYYTTPIVYQSRNVGILLVSVSIKEVMDMVPQTQQDFALVSILILLAMIMIGILIARWISKPIAQMTNAIQKMSHGDFSGKVKITGASEIEMCIRDMYLQCLPPRTRD